ncbi:MAG: transporter [Nitrospira sp.]|nr:transporter [Nitrospira sp.]
MVEPTRTFFSRKSGTELFMTGGLMANTTNPHTDYWTAPEFHLEYVTNQLVSNFLSIGLHGYFYSQIANDHPGPTGATALNLLNLNTSAVRSQSYGLGPQIN